MRDQTSSPAAVCVPEWTDEQCIEFACVAFRHAPKNLPAGVTVADIRMAASRVNRAAPEQRAVPDRLLHEVCDELEGVGCGPCIGSMAPFEDLRGRIEQYLAGRPVDDGLESLRADNAHLHRRLRQWEDEWAARQSAWQEEVRRNDERYRKLRAMHWSDSELCVVRHPQNAVRPGHQCPSGEALDAAIDALAARPQGAEVRHA